MQWLCREWGTTNFDRLLCIIINPISLHIYIYIHLVAIVGYTRIPHFQTYPPGKPMEKPWKKTVQYSKWLDGDIQQRHILI